MQHAKLSPSSSARWTSCTKSIEMEQAYPNKGNSASEWGTCVHYLGELMLKGEDVTIGNTYTEQGLTFKVDEEMFDTALDYANYVREYIKPDSSLLIEERFDLSFIAPDTFGTGDATVLNGSVLHIFDLKTGRNIVNADNNTQLMLYALGAIHKLKDEYIDEVHLHIVQSRIGHFDTWEVDIDKLLEFEAFARTQAQKIIDGDTTYNPNASACKWCRHQANCDALREYSENIIKGEFDDLDDIDGKANLINNTHIKRILDNEDLILSFIKAVKEEAQNKLMAGEVIDGYKLIRSRKNKKWIDEAKADTYLKRKLRQEDRYKTTLITPTQAMKKLDEKSRKYLEKLITVPEGDIKLAPLSHKSPAIDVSCDFEEL